MYPYIIKDTFILCLKVQAPEGFTLSVEFISCCKDFNVTWQFNGKSVDTNHVINTTVVKNCHYNTSLKLEHSCESDTGTYTLTVTSGAGSDSVNISVKVISKLEVKAIRYMTSYADTHSRACTHMHTHAHTYMHTHTRTHIRMHTHTHMHAHTCTHTHARTHIKCDTVKPGCSARAVIKFRGMLIKY